MAQRADPDVERAAELVGRWRVIMRERFEQSRAYSSETLDGTIDEFLSIGAVRAVRDRASARQLQDVDRDVEKFAGAMVRAGDRQSNGTIALDEEAFTTARQSMCPLYPFC